MVMSAKLANQFYRQFSEETATEFVEWFNTVFAQTESKFDQALAREVAILRSEMQTGFAMQDAKLERRFSEAQKNLTELDLRVTRELAGLRIELHAVEKRMALQLVGTMATFIGVCASFAGLYLKH